MRNINKELNDGADFGKIKEQLSWQQELPIAKTHLVRQPVNAVYHPEEPLSQQLWWSCPSCGIETHNATSGKPVIFPVECGCGAQYVVKVNY